MADWQGETRRAATIVFSGVFVPGAFADFVHHRAERLELIATMVEDAPERISVAVYGEPAMIEAFEMACSLGPLSCLVLDVTRHDDAMAS